MERRLQSGTLIGYCALFYVVWTAWEILVRPAMQEAMGEWPYALAGNAVKLLVWTLPALVLVRLYQANLAVPLRGLLAERFALRPFLTALAVFAVYHLLAACLMYGRIAVKDGFAWPTLLGTVLLVGVTEEAVFRAWLLNAFVQRMRPSLAVALNAVLFLLIHFPSWLRKGLFADPSAAVVSCVGILALSAVFSWSFLRCKSLWPPILLHMSWNLMNTLLF